MINACFEHAEFSITNAKRFLTDALPAIAIAINAASVNRRKVQSPDLKSRLGVSPLSGDVFSSVAYSEKPHIALKLLKSFHENTRLSIGRFVHNLDIRAATDPEPTGGFVT